MWLAKLHTVAVVFGVAALLAGAGVSSHALVAGPQPAAPKPAAPPAAAKKPAPPQLQVESAVVNKLDAKKNILTAYSQPAWPAPQANIFWALTPQNQNWAVAPNDTVWQVQPSNVWPSYNLVTTDHLVSQAKAHRLAPNIKVLIDGKEGKLGDLAQGTSVMLTTAGGLVTRIEANGSTMQACFIQSFDPVKKTLKVKHYNGVYGYEVRADARVVIDGKPSALADLKKDMEVTLRFSAIKSRVLGIDAAGPTVPCVLGAVDPARRTLTARLAKEHLTARDVPIAPDAIVILDGKPARLADLKPGIPVVLRMSADPEQSRVVGIRVGK